MIPFLRPDELEVDESGSINWHALWRKELAQLQQATDEQEKAGAGQDWYRMMLIKVRTAMMMTEPIPPPPHAIPGQPPNPGEVPVPVPVPMREQQ